MCLLKVQIPEKGCTQIHRYLASLFICQTLHIKEDLIVILIKQGDSYLADCKEHLKYKILLYLLALEHYLCNLLQWQIPERTFFSFHWYSLSITLAPDKP